MKISKWIDQLLIYEQDKLYRRVILLCFFTGPLLNAYMFYERDIDVSSKLNISVVVYISYIFLIYGSFRETFRKLKVETVVRSWSGRYFLTFLICMATFLFASHIMYEYVYTPLLNYQRPKNFEVLVGTGTIYSIVISFIIESFRNEIDYLLD